MLGFRVFFVFFVCLYMVSTATGSSIKVRKERGAGGNWGYTDTNGPSTWGGVCQLGRKQSPINIELGSVIVADYPSFVFEDSYLTKRKFVAKNNGHTVYVTLEDDSIKPVISGGGLENKFIFEQLHLHWESEHEFDGKRADLEMHIVHYNSKYKSFAEASTKPDGLVVLAVIFNNLTYAGGKKIWKIAQSIDNEPDKFLLQESENTNNLIEDFFGYILDESTLSDRPSYPAPADNHLPRFQVEDNSGSYALRNLLPEYVSRFFRYEGSLTTPGCGEVVQWTIFIERLPVSADVLNAFRTLRDHDGNLLSHNYRPPQKLNGREVFIQIKNYDGRPVRKFEQLTNGVTSPKSALSIPVFCGLLLLSRFN